MSNLKDFRKEQLAEFRDLFTALFKIPDKAVQKRVIDAINGSCKCFHQREITCDISTQTDSDIESAILTSKIQINTSSEFKDSIAVEENPMKRSADAEVDEHKTNVTKRRRRNKRIPRVEKHDASKDEAEKKLKTPDSSSEAKKEKQNDLSALLDCFELSDINEIQTKWLNTKENLTRNDVIQQMIKEWELSEKYFDGYYPIHHAIIESNLKKLQRQFYVFTHKKKNINLLLTERNQDTPIQLALKSNSLPTIIKALIEKKPDMKQIDKNGNTLIHLVMLHTDDTEILSILLSKIELDMLLELNDDGLSPLHIGVIQNKFFMCKTLLEFINLKFGIQNVGLHINDEVQLSEIFTKEIFYMPYKKYIKLNKLKCKILNQKDLKHDRTALFFAIVNKRSKLLINLLLVNLADPSIEDRSSNDCISYAKDIMEKTSGSELLLSLTNTAAYISNCSTI